MTTRAISLATLLLAAAAPGAAASTLPEVVEAPVQAATATNARGDALLVRPGRRGGLVVRFAPAGQAFGPAERIAGVQRDVSVRAALDASGAALIAWTRETRRRVQVHGVVRERAGAYGRRRAFSPGRDGVDLAAADLRGGRAAILWTRHLERATLSVGAQGGGAVVHRRLPLGLARDQIIEDAGLRLTERGARVVVVQGEEPFRTDVVTVGRRIHARTVDRGGLPDGIAFDGRDRPLLLTDRDPTGVPRYALAAFRVPGDDPVLAVGGGAAAVAWTDEGGRILRYRRRSPGRRAFGPQRRLRIGARRASLQAVAVDARGRLAFAYTVGRDKRQELWVRFRGERRRVARGATLGVVALAVDPAGRVRVVAAAGRRLVTPAPF